MDQTAVTIQAILKKAIHRESESQALYASLSLKMKQDAAKDAFHQLVVEEKGHQEKLEKYLNGELKGRLESGHVIDYRIAEKLDFAPLTPDIGLKEVFIMAANREKAAYEFYFGLAGVHQPGEVRSLLHHLGEQELQHKNKVEYLYTDVAFPQTDGG
jgi:rubrerythrin